MIKNNILIIISLVVLTACNSKNVEYKYPKMAKDEKEAKMGNILTGDDSQGINLFGGDNSRVVNGVAANTLLWQASLDIVNFMPITVSDYNGGVIATDWYEKQGHHDVRYRVSIKIKGQELSAKSLSVTMFKQVYTNGSWQSAKVSDTAVKEFEMKILNRAREIKISGAQSGV